MVLILLPTRSLAGVAACSDFGAVGNPSSPIFFSVNGASGSITPTICGIADVLTGLYQIDLNPGSAAVTSLTIGTPSLGSEDPQGTSQGVTMAFSLGGTPSGAQPLDISFSGLGGSGGLDASFTAENEFAMDRFGFGNSPGEVPLFIDGSFVGDILAPVPEPPTAPLFVMGLGFLILFGMGKAGVSRKPLASPQSLALAYSESCTTIFPCTWPKLRALGRDGGEIRRHAFSPKGIF